VTGGGGGGHGQGQTQRSPGRTGKRRRWRYGSLDGAERRCAAGVKRSKGRRRIPRCGCSRVVTKNGRLFGYTTTTSPQIRAGSNPNLLAVGWDA
jgi:hypothetical protein